MDDFNVAEILNDASKAMPFKERDVIVYDDKLAEQASEEAKESARLKHESDLLLKSALHKGRLSKTSPAKLAAKAKVTKSKVYNAPFFDVGFQDVLDIYSYVFDGLSVKEALNQVGEENFNFRDGDIFANIVSRIEPHYANAALMQIEKHGHATIDALRHKGIYQRSAFVGERRLSEGLNHLEASRNLVAIVQSHELEIAKLNADIDIVKSLQQTTVAVLDSTGLVAWKRQVIVKYSAGITQEVIAIEVGKSLSTIKRVISLYKKGELI
tara:strand:- start:114 stop:920 length:807 start_codon:yes stop_codon:yes gene_type:complete